MTESIYDFQGCRQVLSSNRTSGGNLNQIDGIVGKLNQSKYPLKTRVIVQKHTNSKLQETISKTKKSGFVSRRNRRRGDEIYPTRQRELKVLTAGRTGSPDPQHGIGRLFRTSLTVWKAGVAAPPSNRLSRARLSQSDRDVLIHLSCPLSLSSYPFLRLLLLCLPPPFPFAKRPAVHVRFARAFKFTLDDQCCSSNWTHKSSHDHSMALPGRIETQAISTSRLRISPLAIGWITRLRHSIFHLAFFVFRLEIVRVIYMSFSIHTFNCFQWFNPLTTKIFIIIKDLIK